jgi:hypothetical protein
LNQWKVTFCFRNCRLILWLVFGFFGSKSTFRSQTKGTHRVPRRNDIMEQHPNTRKVSVEGCFQRTPYLPLLSSASSSYRRLNFAIWPRLWAIWRLALIWYTLPVWPILVIMTFINRPLCVTYEIHCISGCSPFLISST